MAELDPRTAQLQSKAMARYVEGFDRGLIDSFEAKNARQFLAETLDHLYETAAMLGNMAERVAGTQAAAEPDTETMVAEVAAALEVVRARHIVKEVQSLDIGGKDADMPTQFQAGYQLACEEILTRIGGAHTLAAQPRLDADGFVTMEEHDRLYALKHASEAAAVEPAAQSEPTTEQLQAAFSKDSGGPNPYYRCNACGAIKPGLPEYLAAHWRTHRPAALAAQPPAPQAEPSVKICEDVRDRLWYDAKREQAAGADDCMVALRRYYASPAPEGAVETAKASEAKDAARYRWLRDEDVEVPDGQRDISVWLDRLPHSDQFDKQLFGEEMDAAIDAALATPSTEGAK